MQSDVVSIKRVALVGIVGVWVFTCLLYLLPMVLFITDKDLLFKVSKYTVMLSVIFCLTNIAVRMNMIERK